MKSLAELAAIKEKAQNNVDLRKKEGAEKRIVVGMATCGIAAGARPVLAAFVDEVGTRGLKDVLVSQTGCIGVCRLEPIAEVFMPCLLYTSAENELGMQFPNNDQVRYIQIEDTDAPVATADANADGGGFLETLGRLLSELFG